jgi:hypothetical protein
MKRFWLVIGFLLGFCEAGIADGLTARSLWKNQRGSELRITAVTGTRLHGTFTNYDPNYQCQGIAYPITGFTTGGPTQFTVNFVKCSTVTTWNGSVQGFGYSAGWVLRYKGQTTGGYDFFSRVN